VGTPGEGSKNVEIHSDRFVERPETLTQVRLTIIVQVVKYREQDPTLHIPVKRDLADRVDQYADRVNRTRTNAVARLLEAGLRELEPTKVDR
jgi:hypothetical protein